ncbi:MAG: hypothetical protein AAF483_03095 [Planctomycetota bacterium]
MMALSATLMCLTGCGWFESGAPTSEAIVPPDQSAGSTSTTGEDPARNSSVTTKVDSQLANNRPTVSQATLALALAAIQNDESNTLELEEQAPDNLPEQIRELDGKLLDLLLDGGGLNGAGLSQLAPLKSLFHLRIRNEALSNKALQTIATNHPQLEILNLPQAQVDAQGIAHLQGLPRLRQLRLSGPGLDDSAAEEIAKLPSLEYLHLIKPNISAQGLEMLSISPKLASLYIDDCPLPDAAWTELFQAKPQLHVHINQEHHDRDPNADPHP